MASCNRPLAYNASRVLYAAGSTTPDTGTTPAAAPALSGRGLALLAGLLGGVAALQLHRRRTRASTPRQESNQVIGRMEES